MATQEVEMEHVPLKSDTEGGDETKGEGEVKEVKPGFGKKLGGFFHRKTATKDVTDEKKDVPPADMMTTTEVKEVKPKKPVWPPAWLQRKKCCDGANGEGKENTECPTQCAINMVDRDERNVNEHMKLVFEDILAEPDTNHSFDCAWRLTYRTFSCSRCVIYKFVALLFAIPCALIWGIVFALLAVLNIWAVVPAARALTIPAIWIAKAWNFIIRSLFDPLFRSCGLCFSSIHMRRYGLTNDATAEMA